MQKTALLPLAVAMFGLASPLVSHADFLGDSKANLEFRNFYFNSDYRQDKALQSKRDEWAQGFILKYESGYTQGPLGFGVDAISSLGLKLDSGPDRQNTGLLPVGDDKAPDSYGSFGAAAKVRFSKTTLKAGTLIPSLPTVSPSDSRLLPQTFQGVQLTSQELDGLTFNAGRLNRNKQRNVSGNELMIVAGEGIRGGRETDRFDFAGLRYRWNQSITTSYDYGYLEDNYRQHMLEATHVLPIADNQSLRSELRYARSTGDGSSNVDNTALGARFTYSLGTHALSLGLQKMQGDTGFPRINGTSSYLINFVVLSPNFANPDERSWQIRYDYDFAAIGIPGLSFMTRYLYGDNYQLGNGRSASEWERNSDLGYVFQSGSLKNVQVKWRNGSYRSSGASDIDLNALVISYTLPLF